MPPLILDLMTASVVALIALAVFEMRRSSKLAQSLLEARESEAQALDRAEVVRDLLDPLFWLWGLAVGPKERSFVASAIITAQMSLGLSDEEMAEEVRLANDPPRHVPKRQKPPPYLAGPEDLVQATPGVITVEGSLTQEDLEALRAQYPDRRLVQAPLDVIPETAEVADAGSGRDSEGSVSVYQSGQGFPKGRACICPQGHVHPSGEGMAPGWPCPDCGGPLEAQT